MTRSVVALAAIVVACLAACGGTAAVPEGQNAFDCRDGADNDGDGTFDCADLGCVGSPDCRSDVDAAVSDAGGIDAGGGVDAAVEDAGVDAEMPDAFSPDAHVCGEPDTACTVDDDCCGGFCDLDGVCGL